MGETKHTPGPWKAERVSAEQIEIGAETPQGHLSVAWVHLGEAPSERESNEGMTDARLLAAAPELLSELKRMLAAAEADDLGPGHFEDARQVIFKAEGRRD